MIDRDAAVFWRRRAVAAAVVLGLVLVVVWAVSRPSRPAEPRAARATDAAGSAPLSFTTPSSGPSPAARGQRAADPLGGLPKAGEPVAPPSLLPMPSDQLAGHSAAPPSGARDAANGTPSASPGRPGAQSLPSATSRPTTADGAGESSTPNGSEPVAAPPAAEPPTPPNAHEAQSSDADPDGRTGRPASHQSAKPATPRGRASRSVPAHKPSSGRAAAHRAGAAARDHSASDRAATAPRGHTATGRVPAATGGQPKPGAKGASGATRTRGTASTPAPTPPSEGAGSVDPGEADSTGGGAGRPRSTRPTDATTPDGASAAGAATGGQGAATGDQSAAGAATGGQGAATGDQSAAGAATGDQGAAGATTEQAGSPGSVPRCADSDIGLVAQVGAESYRVSQRPTFRLVVANIGQTACARDLDAGLQDLMVTDVNGAPIWSSNDCYPARHSDVRTLQPGKPLVFSLSWSGRTSSAGCPANRKNVPAGTYRLVAKLGALISKPAPFTLTN
jgi:hypothetical protein